jgi:hypothetical protein
MIQKLYIYINWNSSLKMKIHAHIPLLQMQSECQQLSLCSIQIQSIQCSLEIVLYKDALHKSVD